MAISASVVPLIWPPFILWEFGVSAPAPDSNGDFTSIILTL
jgi:hypothetical protein